jgi:hypothetical protein
MLKGICIFCFTTFVFNLATTVCHAAEIDSVTTRKVALEDSRNELNRIFNQRIKAGIAQANMGRSGIDLLDDLALKRENDYCNEEDLYRELRKAVFDSNLVALGLKGYQLDLQLRGLLAKKSYSLSLNDSIYRDIDYIEGISLNLKDLSDVVNIKGHLIGLDKMGHFFAEGWQYYSMLQSEEKSLYDALAWGRERESGLFGYTTTGIFSFADLAANFNGMRFWIKVLGKRDDPLKGVIGNLFDRPYVTCDIQFVESIKAGKIIKAWEQNQRFDIADFVDGSWDEGNNCNSYADPVIEEKVSKRIQSVSPDFVCPLRREACARAHIKYGEYAKYLLHPNCLSAQK